MGYLRSSVFIVLLFLFVAWFFYTITLSFLRFLSVIVVTVFVLKNKNRYKHCFYEKLAKLLDLKFAEVLR